MKRAWILIFLLIGSAGFAQWPETFLPGYSKSIRGGGFQYHSPQPDVGTSMLVRSMDKDHYIEWETVPVPERFSGKEISFVWIYGIDANTDSHNFSLGFNGKEIVTFSNPLTSVKDPLLIKGRDGTALEFRPTILDKYDDPMGFAILSVPSSMIIPGKPQRITITGESAGSRSWYMTFEAVVREEVSFTQEQAVLNTPEGMKLSGIIGIVHLGEQVKGTLTVKGISSQKIILRAGYNAVRVLFPLSDTNVARVVSVRLANGQKRHTTVTIRNVRPWFLYLVQHTHTDIGYTRPQTEILPEHLRYIDFALDYCDQTDAFPDDAKFRWTCETTWAVREFFKSRPASQLERLKARVKEGRIEVTGLFLNSSDLADEASIVASLQPVRLFRNNGIEVTSAMQDDINGIPWCYVDYLSGCGIRYLSMAQNVHRARKPFEKPTPFWWESPTGNRLLVNRPEHYMWANQLGILTNQETFAKNLFEHLNTIVNKGYPFNRYAIHFSGYLTDNSPPSTKACDIVKSWNESYAWPKLRLATMREYMDYIAAEHPNELPVVKGAWPDWWMDGFGSAALETAYARMAHADLIANNGLAAMAILDGKKIPDYLHGRIDDMTDALAFYDEHTFGAAESITDPLAENSVVQWGEKGAYAWEAVKRNRIIREQIMGLIQDDLPVDDVPTLTVFNTLNWHRSGTVTIFADYEIMPKDGSAAISDENGRNQPYQAESFREDGAYWTIAVDDVPPCGYRTFRINRSNMRPSPPTMEKFDGTIANGQYRLVFDTIRGGLASALHLTSGEEIVDSSSAYRLGAFIYERLGSNRHQLEQYRLDEFTRTEWHDLSFSDVRRGPVWDAVTMTGKVEECATNEGISCEIRLYHHQGKIEFRYSMKKLAVPDPEAVYVAFPFHLNDARILYEGQGKLVDPVHEQIEGASSDWTGVQNFISVTSSNRQILFSTPEIPLVQLGGINTGRFMRIPEIKKPELYSWVLNNYWTTNFRAYQEGELKWTYRLKYADSPSGITASRFGWGERVPLLSRIIPAGKSNDAPVFKSFTGSSLRNLLLVSARPEEGNNAIILHLREIEGSPAEVPLSGLQSATAALEITEVNVLGEQVARPDDVLTFKPYEAKFIRIVVSR